MSLRNQPCSCGSGQRFKHCCGAIGGARQPSVIRDQDGASPYSEIGYFLPQHRGRDMLPFCTGLPECKSASLNWTPPGVLVVENYLDSETCDRWKTYFDAQTTSPATVQEVGNSPGKAQQRFAQSERRITDFVPLGDLAAEIRKTLWGAYKQVIIPHFSEQLDWMAQPGVLKYSPGGKYDLHADSEYWKMDTGRWVRSMDRDYSLLIYVNDDYEGGALYFQNFDVRIQPGRGMLIAFPSDHRFLHAAEPLISGTRYAVVCWAAAKSSVKLNPPPQGAIRQP